MSEVKYKTVLAEVAAQELHEAVNKLVVSTGGSIYQYNVCIMIMFSIYGQVRTRVEYTQYYTLQPIDSIITKNIPNTSRCFN